MEPTVDGQQKNREKLDGKVRCAAVQQPPSCQTVDEAEAVMECGDCGDFAKEAYEIYFVMRLSKTGDNLP